MTAMPVAMSSHLIAIAADIGVCGLTTVAFNAVGINLMVRWVNNAMSFAMFFAFIATFAVKLR